MTRLATALLFCLLASDAATEASAQAFAILDTTYTPAGYEDGDLAATIYTPFTCNGAGIIMAHWYGGARQTMRPWCENMASRGYLAMAIDYHDFSDAARGVYPRPVRALKVAVEFLRRNAARFGISPRRIAGFGQSEGAIHWGEAMVWDNDDAYFRTDDRIDDRLDAAVLLYGLYDNDRYLQGFLSLDQLLRNYFAPDPSLRSTKGNCIANSARITTPVLIVHGTGDVLIPYQHSVALHESLMTHGKSSRLLLLPGLGHGFDIGGFGTLQLTADGQLLSDSVSAFLARVLNVTGIETRSREIASSSKHVAAGGALLEPCVPNPFNGATTIQFSVPRRSDIDVTVLTMLGQPVARLLDGSAEAGTHTVRFNAGGLPSGAYICRLRAGGQTVARLMLLVR